MPFKNSTGSELWYVLFSSLPFTSNLFACPLFLSFSLLYTILVSIAVNMLIQQNDRFYFIATPNMAAPFY
jgi:hypothetical protein